MKTKRNVQDWEATVIPAINKIVKKKLEILKTSKDPLRTAILNGELKALEEQLKKEERDYYKRNPMDLATEPEEDLFV
jgi:hypothetical protein